MGEIFRCCENPQITYLAPVNININERTIGSVDVWRCAVCKKKFCEEKQLGIESLTEIVGMPKIEDNEKKILLNHTFDSKYYQDMRLEIRSIFYQKKN